MRRCARVAQHPVIMADSPPSGVVPHLRVCVLTRASPGRLRREVDLVYSQSDVKQRHQTVLQFRTAMRNFIRSQKTINISLAICLVVCVWVAVNRYDDPITAEEMNLVQMQRRDDLDLACRILSSTREPEYTLETIAAGASRTLYDHIVDDTHRLIYCFVPKVACSEWKKTMALLTEAIPSVPPRYISRGEIHSGALYRFLYNYQYSQVVSMLHNYTSFMFSRHPLERIASAYANKFILTHKVGLKMGYAPKIRLWYRKHYNRTLHEDLVPFEVFVLWATDPFPDNLEGPRDAHWDTIDNLCHPCLIKYNFLGKMDTIARDSAYLLKIANVSSLVQMDVYAPTKSRAIAQKLIGSLSDRAIVQLVRYFAADFLLFGYDPGSIFPDGHPTGQLTRQAFRSVFDIPDHR